MSKCHDPLRCGCSLIAAACFPGKRGKKKLAKIYSDIFFEEIPKHKKIKKNENTPH